MRRTRKRKVRGNQEEEEGGRELKEEKETKRRDCEEIFIKRNMGGERIHDKN